ncbi:MAG: hypothetical protein EZS28_006681 [Streblomastix strix]|uniref:Uncharacterized protein n=1 Tax=Streblomastix strix TaxID=222440 RepID=A0A5J4WS88_9EUKA|nr:MAG: hypothetical protein EZS28_006681 [Streblomastix strix]
MVTRQTKFLKSTIEYVSHLLAFRQDGAVCAIKNDASICRYIKGRPKPPQITFRYALVGLYFSSYRLSFECQIYYIDRPVYWFTCTGELCDAASRTMFSQI